MLGDDTAAALVELRAHALSRMRATVRIVRPGQPSTSVDGIVTTPAQTVYLGPARWKAGTTTATRTEVGATQLVTTPGEVHLPVDNPDGYSPRPGDVIECTANPDRPQLVGRRVTVRARMDGDDLSAFRIPMEA